MTQLNKLNTYNPAPGTVCMNAMQYVKSKDIQLE